MKSSAMQAERGFRFGDRISNARRRAKIEVVWVAFRICRSKVNKKIRVHFFYTRIGIVIKILPDDNVGSRHQRFIIRLSSGQILIIAHNIDLASRLHSLSKGDIVVFNGEYGWNSKGGIIHWTHRDPNGRGYALNSPPHTTFCKNCFVKQLPDFAL